jgi:membrane protein DedA with SNARE-associated domain
MVIIITHLINRYGYIAITVLVMMESLGLPVPGETSLIAGAIYSALHPHFRISIVISSAIIGSIIGDNLGYIIGSTAGIKFLQRKPNEKNFIKRVMEYTNNYFKKYGMKTILFGKFITILRLFIPISAGIHKFNRIKFIIYDAIGAIVWAVFYGVMSYLLGQNIPLLLKVLNGLTILIIVIIITTIIVIRYRLIIHERNK